ncbi:MAG: hypothetical protein HQ522_16665 [Bacteroidetes bacterium]|nr:hypothetical protein [Bacteroidota bacterium]
MGKKQSAASAAKKDEHQIIYEIPGANLSEVIAIAFNIFDKTWVEPFSLMLPDKTVLPWRRPLAAKFIRNEITEVEY